MCASSYHQSVVKYLQALFDLKKAYTYIPAKLDFDSWNIIRPIAIAERLEVTPPQLDS